MFTAPMDEMLRYTTVASLTTPLPSKTLRSPNFYYTFTFSRSRSRSLLVDVRSSTRAANKIDLEEDTSCS